MVPTFGTREPDKDYVDRAAAYVVVFKDDSVAAVCSNGKCSLPGGGREEGESAEQTLHREAREELGLQLKIFKKLGEAEQYFFSPEDGRHFKSHASFHLAEFTGPAEENGKYEVTWVPLGELENKSFHEFQIWAVRKALET